MMNDALLEIDAATMTVARHFLLKQGSVLAAYTTDSRTPETDTEAVSALASERPARIEVRGDDTTRQAIDAEAVLSRQS